jgi:beta-glucosidase
MNFDKHRIESARTRIILAGLVSLATAGVVCSADAPKLGKSPIKTVVAAMSLEEKAGVLVGEGMWFEAPKNEDGTETKLPDFITKPVVGETYKLVLGAAGTTYPVPRLGITSSVLSDGPAGLRINPTRPGDVNTYYCTAFPVATLLASTWDTNLVAQVGKAMGNEVLEYGADVLLAPGMNIHRNPLCGRNFEYYSEDPLIAGKMAAAMTKGVQSNGVGVSIKHFAANNAETNRNALNVQVSERALREIYLEGFRIAVQEAQPWTVMSSYNKINDTFASESGELLNKVLRTDWGFKGYVMTDWFAGTDPIAKMKAGNDLIMPGDTKQREAIVKAVKEGKLDEKVLNQNVERFLTVLAQGPRAKGYAYSNKPDLKAHAQVTRQAATEGMVLLKNTDNTLPFGQDIKKIAAFGNTSYQIITGGTGSGDVNKAYSVPLVEGLQNAGLTVNPSLKTLYTSYTSLVKEGRPKNNFWFMGEPTIAEMDVTADLAKSVAALSDAAIITIGRNSGEGTDRTNVEGDFKLTPAEQNLIQRVTAAFHAKKKKAIVVLNIGGSIETASWREVPDAILLAWQGGQETGNSIADILSGRVTPSGKLATTFVMKYEDVPSTKTFPGHELTQRVANQGLGFGEAKPAEDTYNDGIYVGYRYYDAFNVPTAYEFGYGLSYTTFGYSNAKISAPAFKDKLTVTVDVKNTGKIAGKEVVQLYLTAPAAKLDKPAKELKGFAKTKLLAPGESETVTFTLDAHNLASFDPAISTWIAEAGQYDVKLGASSKDIRANATFTLGKELAVKKESVALTPKAPIAELKAPARK